MRVTRKVDQGGSAMLAKRSAVGLARLREEFRARADQAFDQMFGWDGQNGLETFTEREDRACEATDALARWLMEEHLALDSAADPGAQVDCPICEGPRRSWEVLADLPMSTRHVWRITGRLGRERGQQRDAAVTAMQAGDMKPRYAEPPVVAAIHLDAGKIQLRQSGGGPGVRGPHWADTKVGCFLTYTPISGDRDPQPDPPAVFLNPPRVMRLCREMERVRGTPAEECRASAITADEPLLVEQQPQIERAERLVRTAVATLGSVGH